MPVYVALLRGINVGGNNLIKMSSLHASFRAMGYNQVQTYIQSGNVIFYSQSRDLTRLISQIQTALASEYHYDARLVLKSMQQLSQLVDNAPEGFGSEPTLYRYDVYFIMEPMTTDDALAVIQLREGVDWVWGGDRVFYSRRLISKATHSRLPKIISLPIYQYLTGRNWNTVTNLLGLMRSAQNK